MRKILVILIFIGISSSGIGQNIIASQTAISGGQLFLTPPTGTVIVASSFKNIAVQDTLYQCKFYIEQATTAPGYCHAQLYAHTGVYGASGSGATGSALVNSSDSILASSINSSGGAWYTFHFTGAGRYVLAASTAYCIALYYTNCPDNSQSIMAYGASSGSVGVGNRYYSGTWNRYAPGAGKAFAFYVYGSPYVASTSISKVDGVTQASLSKIDGVTNANIKKVDGVANQ